MASTGPLFLCARLALGLVLGAALLVQSAAPAQANGVHIGSREVFAGEAGPYRLAVTTTPVEGAMHFIILLSTAGEGAPVEDAAITMRGDFADGEGVFTGPVQGYGTIEGLQWYAADLEVAPAGLWEFTLTVDSALGQESVTFAVPVLEPGGGNLTLFALIIIALAILGFTLGNRMFGRRRRAGGRRPQG
ncbi:MAG: hypothetical protein OXT51_06300 [Chloroflexota bacterium]|nr:hypothetical protein [Chloroflexota bacterium]